MKRRLFAGASLVGVAALVLTACGGGGGSDAVTLAAAYGQVSKGMTYAQVRDIVGYEYNGGKQEFPTEVTYSWQSGNGTATPALLSVKFENGGATGKIYVDTTRNDSLFW